MISSRRTGPVKYGLLLILCALMVGTACAEQGTGTPVPVAAQENMTSIARDVYVYGYPLVLMDITKGQLTAIPQPADRQAPVNQFIRANRTPTPRFTLVVSPNIDTLYASAFLDLTDEPLVLAVPDTKGRYYLMPLLDSWSNVFASPGTRTTGNGPGIFLITGPGWNGPVPAGMSRIAAPTNTVWIAGRTLVNASDPGDIAAARAIQDQYTLTPLSAWGTAYTPPSSVPVDASVDMITPPPEQVVRMTPEQFYTRMSRLFVTNPPPAADSVMVQEMAELGIVPGKSFDWNSTDQGTREALAKGAADGKIAIAAAAHASRNATNNWLMMKFAGSYGTRYMERAATAWVLLGANLPEDTIYSQTRSDADGLPLNGTSRYTIHFGPNATPPARGFWSITLYNEQQFLVNNSINRYSLGDRSPLRYNADGSLDLYIQQDSPGQDRESNWLPAPPGGFNLFLRQYWPSEEVLTGRWIPPAVIRVQDTPPAGTMTPVTPTVPAPQRTTAESPLAMELVLTGIGSAGYLVVRRW
jgi:hypothetical protein